MSPSPSIFRGQGFQTLLATQGVNIQSRESERNASSDKEVCYTYPSEVPN